MLLSKYINKYRGTSKLRYIHQGDLGTCGLWDLGTWGTWGLGDLGTWGPGDLGTWGHRNKYIHI